MLVASVLLTCRILSRFQNGEDGTYKEVTYNLEKEGVGQEPSCGLPRWRGGARPLFDSIERRGFIEE